MGRGAGGCCRLVSRGSCGQRLAGVGTSTAAAAGRDLLPGNLRAQREGRPGGATTKTSCPAEMRASTASRGGRRSNAADRSCRGEGATASGSSSPSANRSPTTSPVLRGPDKWGWLEVYPQHVFFKHRRVNEEMSGGRGPECGGRKRLASLSDPRALRSKLPRRQGAGDRKAKTLPAATSPSSGIGRCSMTRASSSSPAGTNGSPDGSTSSAPFHQPGPVMFVDQFDQEHSRDIEPMQGGHGDNYYYQMIASIRRYKGARPIPPIEPWPITIDGRSTIGTTCDRSSATRSATRCGATHPGWGKQVRYVNHTGRNDIVAAKVSYDQQNVYFYVRTREPSPPPPTQIGCCCSSTPTAIRKRAGWATTSWSTGKSAARGRLRWNTMSAGSTTGARRQESSTRRQATNWSWSCLGICWERKPAGDDRLQMGRQHPANRRLVGLHPQRRRRPQRSLQLSG